MALVPLHWPDIQSKPDDPFVFRNEPNHHSDACTQRVPIDLHYFYGIFNAFGDGSPKSQHLHGSQNDKTCLADVRHAHEKMFHHKYSFRRS